MMLRKYLIRIVPGLKSLASSRLTLAFGGDLKTRALHHQQQHDVVEHGGVDMLGRRPNHFRTSTFSV